MIGMGGTAWNSGQAELWSEALCAQFETSFSYGNGNIKLLPSTILNACQLFQSSNIRNDLDFALVVIQMHDAKEDGHLVSIIEKLPKLATNTLYFISACYSGKYHEFELQEGVSLLSDASSNESSSASDFAALKNLSSFFGAKQANMEDFINWAYESLCLSEPYFSGNLGGRQVKNLALKNAVRPESAVVNGFFEECFGEVDAKAFSVVMEYFMIFHPDDISYPNVREFDNLNQEAIQSEVALFFKFMIRDGNALSGVTNVINQFLFDQPEYAWIDLSPRPVQPESFVQSEELDLILTPQIDMELSQLGGGAQIVGDESSGCCGDCSIS